MSEKRCLYLGIVILFLFLLLFTTWIVQPALFEGKQVSIISPLPSYLTMSENNQVSALDVWSPSVSVFGASIVKKPEIEAKSAIIYDLTTDKVLFAKFPKEKLPFASLTKIMTAIIALENPKKDNRYMVTKSELVGEDSMGVTPGEVLTLEDLLYGLMLPSGNDAAEVLAGNYSGGRSAFIYAMNEKAKSFGLTDTKFTNPSGLQGDGNQHTTAYDLLVMTSYALKNFSLFRNAVSTFSYTIPYTDEHKAFYLENETNLLTSYPGVKGVKTGYTPEAGLCLVTYLNYGDHQIIGIILGSNNRRWEMIELLDYSLNSLGIPPPLHR